MTRPLRAWWPTVLFGATVATAYAIGPDQEIVEGAVNLTIYTAFSITGGWIYLRSGNRMGRLFQVLAVLSAWLFLTESYVASYVPGGTKALPEGGLDLAIVWMNNLLFVPFFVTNFVLPFLLFPTGRAASRHWGYVVRGILWWTAAVLVATIVAPRVELHDGTAANPWAIDALAVPATILTDNLFSVISLLGLLAVVSLGFRYRGAQSEERAQIRWFLFAGVFLILALILDEVILDALSLDAPALERAIELTALLVGLLGLPVATAIAILKYRLYEVDVVINKTLVYGSLTVILAALYGLLVVGIQRLLPAATTDSDFAVAAATLAVAGAFRPLRARLQAFIDRRFYRRRYDAAATLGEFASHARDEVDLDSLSRELVRVVATTMHPAHASLWLRQQESS